MLRSLLAAWAFSGCLYAQATADWTEPIAPFRVMDNVYYVGSRGLATYLITTPRGHILINSNLTSSPPMIKQNVEKLGFRFSDVKILLISHAHWDHCAGSAAIKEMTGAQYMVMDGDAQEIEAGGKGNVVYGNTPGSLYPPAKVDRVLHDGDEVKLGGAVLTAHLTPGHTKGCTTWSMRAREAGKTYNVVIVGSPNGNPANNPGSRLVNNALYPQIAQDYERMFRTLKSLPCDVFLGAHGNYFGMEAKVARIKAGERNPFIDPEGYQKYVAQKEQEFRAELQKQSTAK